MIERSQFFKQQECSWEHNRPVGLNGQHVKNKWKDGQNIHVTKTDTLLATNRRLSDTTDYI